MASASWARIHGMGVRSPEKRAQGEVEPALDEGEDLVALSAPAKGTSTSATGRVLCARRARLDDIGEALRRAALALASLAMASCMAAGGGKATASQAAAAPEAPPPK